MKNKIVYAALLIVFVFGCYREFFASEYSVGPSYQFTEYDNTEF